MLKSTHYDLNLVEGSDIVNPLVIDRPNYETIDGQMFKNQQASIQLATELYDSALKVHALTMLTTSTVFRFVATAKYSTGETFTVNGTQVTALLPTGESLSDGAYVINSTVLCALNGTVLTFFLGSGQIDIAPDSEKLGGQLPGYYATKVQVDAASSVAESAVSIANQVKNSVGEDIIWRNASPSAEFLAATIEFANLKNYRFIRGFFGVPGVSESISITFPVVDGAFAFARQISVDPGNRMFMFSRQLSIPNGLNSIAFGDSYLDTTSPYSRGIDNRYLIPYMVVGIK